METHEDTEPEPQTPMWLPVLGAALFLAWGIWWGTRPVPQAPPAPAIVVSASASASVATPPPGAHR
jgi:hypothetical protein